MGYRFSKERELKLTHARALEVFTYDPILGTLFCKIRRGSCGIGLMEIKAYPPRCYPAVRIDGLYYATHRLVWFIYYSRWPEKELDHKDRDKPILSWPIYVKPHQPKIIRMIRIHALNSVAYRRGSFIATIQRDTSLR